MKGTASLPWPKAASLFFPVPTHLLHQIPDTWDSGPSHPLLLQHPFKGQRKNFGERDHHITISRTGNLGFCRPYDKTVQVGCWSLPVSLSSLCFLLVSMCQTTAANTTPATKEGHV